MTSPYRRIYPSTGDALIFLDGGLNSKFPVSTILDNESPDCLNVSFENGAVETREGITKVNTAPIASASIDGLYTRNDNNSNQTMIAFSNGSAYTLDGSSFITIASSQSNYTPGIRVASSEYENHLFSCDGLAVPYKYNGTDWTRHGVYPPTTTSTVATNAAGLLTGSYNYKVTFENSQVVQGDVGPASVTFTAASESILVSAIPVAPQSYGVSSRNIYRTITSGVEYYLAGTINDNTTTSFVDNVEDDALGATAPTDNGVPSKYGIIKYHQDRLFINDVGNPNLVKYSELTNPYVFKALNFLTVGDNSFDIVKSFEVYENGLLVFGKRTTTLIYMPDTDPVNWVKIVLNGHYGSSSPFGMAKIKNQVIFPATENGEFVGLGVVSGASFQPSATLLTVSASGSDLLSDKIEDQMNLVQQGEIENISSITFKEKVYISVTYGSGETKNNRIYVLDSSISNLSRKQKITMVPWSGISAEQFTIYDNNLYSASSLSDGFVYKMLDGTYNDDSTAIDSYYETKEFTGFKGDENFSKDFRYLRMLVDKAGDYYMNMTAREDSDKGTGNTQQINLNPSGSLWGTMIWGVDLWGGGTYQEDIKVFLGGARGKRIQFRFTNQNTVDQRFKVHWIKYAYNLKGFR